MFLDMGAVSKADAEQIFQASIPWLKDLLSNNEYAGWFAMRNGEAVAGGGVHLRSLGPVPSCLGGGRSGHIANVYTLPTHRRKGLARNLVRRILNWAEAEQLNLLTLSASDEARKLYTSLGFTPTADMHLYMRHG